MLRPDDFDAFFAEVHRVLPFPWQRRLLRHVVDNGGWPTTLDVPTGCGKTAAIDIAVFHLALQAGLGTQRQAPLRVAFVVDRRLVVDDAYQRALKLQQALAEPMGPVTERVAQALMGLSQQGLPLLARRLRGGLPRESDWARTPAQPTVLCSTVDQIGSRLLFRGYGVSDSMKPVHAGLIGADCLILLDEAHLAQPFRDTLQAVQRYRSALWCESQTVAPWGTAVLTATPGETHASTFALDAEDHACPPLRQRLQARKPATLHLTATEPQRRQLFIEQVQAALAAGLQAVGVVFNRVARARQLYAQLQAGGLGEQAELMLLIGPSRPLQRDEVAQRLEPLRTGAPRPLTKPLVVVATQCIEAGVDIDLDALFTEAAPLDALRQRFGRLNRGGRAIDARASVVATKEELGPRTEDPVYGHAIREAWVALNAAAQAPAAGTVGRKSKAVADVTPVVEFGIAHFDVPMAAQALAPKPRAPVLMPSHVDLLSQTGPVPGVDLELSLYLHGPRREADAVSVVWRADIQPTFQHDLTPLLLVLPPRSAEAIELPLWAVKRWLRAPGDRIDDLADAAGQAPEELPRLGPARRVFRWRGAEGSQWVYGDQLRPGDTIVVPAAYGGVDQFGWDPVSSMPARDIADAAAEQRRDKSFAVRIAPGLLGDEVSPLRLAQALSDVQFESSQVVYERLRGWPWPPELGGLLRLLGDPGPRGGSAALDVRLDLYGRTDSDAPRGVVFVARRGLKLHRVALDDGTPLPSTEDDLSGSAPGFAQSLSEHSAQVERQAEAYARAAGLQPERVVDLKLAGWLHDQGKRDRRFQRWMHHGDPLGADPDDEASIWAKSARPLPPSARDKAGLPPAWRHEAQSVRLARAHPRLNEAADPALVLWLVGTHHGYGRPWFPHADPDETAPDIGPQSQQFEWRALSWYELFAVLTRRYGPWELARMEAVLRLADHRASELAAQRSAS